MEQLHLTREEAFIEEIKSTLNHDQRTAFEACIYGDSSVFCTGEGGTGKSWLLECVVKYFREFPLPDNKLVAVTASTGIASFLIKGITLHRFAGTGIEETNITAMITRASRGQSNFNWINTGVLIIDEISMISATFFENLSTLAQSIRHNELPFGGIRLLMFGDFLQLPPISKIDHPSYRVFHADAWELLDPNIVELKSPMRQTDPVFQKILSELRYGICTPETIEYMRGLDRVVQYDDGIAPVRLYSRRDTTDSYNTSMLGTLDTRSVRYRSVDSGDTASLKQCPAAHSLELKVGCQVMLIRNLSSTLVNGSIGTVVRFETSPGSILRKPIVRLMLPDKSVTEISIGRVTWETIAPNGRVVASRVQIPLILAWAITIHKSQGQTIPRICVNMDGIFETGQAYVAISRCTDPSSLQVENFNENLVMAASSCVNFYRGIQRTSVSEASPEYSVNREAENPPSYEPTDAASAAQLTEQTWVNNTAHHPPIGDPTIEAQFMLGHLSLRRISTSSQSDFEN